MYPEYAKINGHEYKIDTDFNTALKCFEVIEDNSITDYERALAIIYLLFDFIPNDNIDLFLEKAKIFLQCGKNDEIQKQEKKDLDFVQDRSYINSSFMSDYHIDLSKEKIHFWLFIDLLEGLTDNSSLNRVRDLRNCDLSEISDLKQREKIKKAQERVALKETKKVFNDKQKKNIQKYLEKTGMI